MKIKKAIIATLSTIGLICVCGGVALPLMPDAEAISISLPESVYIGDVVEIPEKKITKDGVEKVASAQLTDPDGNKYTVGGSFTASTSGLYTLEYYAYFDGVKEVLPKEEITAVRKAADLFETNGLAELSEGSFAYREGLNGVRVKQKVDGEVTFAKTIDISENTKDDLLLELVIEPTSSAADFNNLIVKITDAENEDNFITISALDSGTVNIYGEGAYVKACAPGQTLTGRTDDGLFYTTYPIFGTPLWQAFRTKKDDEWRSDIAYPTLKFYYDYAEKAIYGGGWCSDAASKSTTAMIADFDDPKAFPGNLWEGFTSGKVKISISASGLSSATANYVVLNVAGVDLSQDEFVDKKAPTLEVDYAGESSIPVAAIGKPYKIFDARVEDDYDDNVRLDVAAYYLSADGDKYDVDIVDEYMYPQFGGDYIISYTATDRSGNSSSKEVGVSCFSDSMPITIATTDKNQTVNFYEYVTVGGLDSVTTSGGNGQLKKYLKVYDPDGEEVVLEGNSFFANKIGKYKVVYSVRDYLLNEAKRTITYTVVAPDAPVFTKDSRLPSAFIKGLEYTLPVWEALEADSNDNLEEVVVKTYVNGEELTGSFTATGESVTVKYLASGKSGDTEYVVSIPVIDGNEGKDQSKYFIGTNVDVTENQESIALTTSKEGTTSFANALSSLEFYLAFTAKAENVTYDALQFVLSDAYDRTLSVTLTITFIEGKAVLSYPHSDVTYTFSSTAGDYALSYDNTTYEIFDITNKACGKVGYNDLGKPFTGFSDKVYLTINFVGTKGEGKLLINSINNQPMGYRADNYEDRSDAIAPVIILNDYWTVKRQIGDTAKILAGKVYDVISRIESFTVTVVAPDRSVIFDEVSAFEEYEITLTQYGLYRVTYLATDTNGNTATLLKLIRVVEKEKPVLEVNKESIQTTYKQGDKIELPTYNVSDNSEKYNVDVILMMPNGEARLLMQNQSGNEISYLSADAELYESTFIASENAFYATQKGYYVLRYYAYDEMYNYVIVDIEFTVY